MTEMLPQSWNEALEALVPEMIKIRRYLHSHPEVSFQEYETSQFVYNYVSKLPGVEVVKPTLTSVLVKIQGMKPGKKIGLRADMDALPVTEARDDLEFKSINDGVMHACGHDGHTAILLVAVKFLAEHRADLAGEIYAIFQHAEEKPPGGAAQIAATGLLNDVDFFYGQHLFSTIPVGKIDIKPGPNSANTDSYKVKIFGKGGHASAPNECLDPVVIGTEIIQSFQNVVARFTDPFEPIVLSNTVFQAGDINGVNVIPELAVLGGSVRTTTAASRTFMQTQIELTVKGICGIYGAGYEVEYIIGCDAVQNDPEATAIVEQIAETVFPGETYAGQPTLTGEDFSVYNSIAPSTFVYVGAGNKEQGFDYPHHHPKFGLDENSFITGLKLFVAVAANYSRLTAQH